MNESHNNIVVEYFSELKNIVLPTLAEGQYINQNMDILRKILSGNNFKNYVSSRYNIFLDENSDIYKKFIEYKFNICSAIPTYKTSILKAYLCIVNESIQTLKDVFYDAYTWYWHGFLYERDTFKRFIHNCFTNDNDYNDILNTFDLLWHDPYIRMLNKEEKNYNEQGKEKLGFYYSMGIKDYAFGDILDKYESFKSGYGFISHALGRISKDHSPAPFTMVGYEYLTFKKELVISFTSEEGLDHERDITKWEDTKQFSIKIFNNEIIVSFQKVMFNHEEDYHYYVQRDSFIHFHEGFRDYAAFLFWAYGISEMSNKFDNYKTDLKKYLPFFGITSIEEGKIEESDF